MYITDILPTMAAAANIEVKDEKLDGVNQWKTISENVPTTRKEILYNIESVLGFSAIVNDGWKLVNGSENIKNSDWFGSAGSDTKITFDEYIDDVRNSEAAINLPKLSVNEIKILRRNSTTKCDNFTAVTKCNPLESPCLFNIINDPCEKNNLAETHPEKVKFLLSRLSHHITEMQPTRRKPSDPKSDPKFHNLTWSWWLNDNRCEMKKHSDNNEVFIYLICIIFLTIVLFISLKKMKVVQRSNTKN